MMSKCEIVHCVICEKKIAKQRNRNNRCCSRKCRNEYFKRKNTKYCEVCSKKFITSKKQKCCSKKCGDIHSKKRIIKKCEYCSKEFETIPSVNHRYCSSNCGNKTHPLCWTIEEKRLLIEHYPNMKAKEISKIIGKTEKQIDYMICKNFSYFKKKKPQVLINCDFCGKSFKRYHSFLSLGKWGNFCSIECRGKYVSKNIIGDKHPRWKGGFEPYYGKNWKQIKRVFRAVTPLKCNRCGMTEKEHIKKWRTKLHIHHKIPKRFFEKPERANYLDNLEFLCKSHHTEVDNEIGRDMSKMWKAKKAKKLFNRNVEGLQTSLSKWNKPNSNRCEESNTHVT